MAIWTDKTANDYDPSAFDCCCDDCWRLVPVLALEAAGWWSLACLIVTGEQMIPANCLCVYPTCPHFEASHKSRYCGRGVTEKSRGRSAGGPWAGRGYSSAAALIRCGCACPTCGWIHP